MITTAVSRRTKDSTSAVSRVLNNSGGLWWRVFAVASVLVVWWLATVTFAREVFPSPWTTVVRLVAIVRGGDFASTVLITLGRVSLGMVLTLVIAVTVGIAMGRNIKIQMFLDTYILIGRSIPGLVWALVSVMVVGLNNMAPVLACILTTTPLVVLQIWEASKALDEELFNMAKVFGVGRIQQWLRLLLPSVFPSIIAGAKLGLALAWQVVVLSELFGLGSGVGYEINEAFSNFDLAGVLAWTLSFSAIIAIIEYGVIGQVQRHIERWRQPIRRAV